MAQTTRNVGWHARSAAKRVVHFETTPFVPQGVPPKCAIATSRRCDLGRAGAPTFAALAAVLTFAVLIASTTPAVVFSDDSAPRKETQQVEANQDDALRDESKKDSAKKDEAKQVEPATTIPIADLAHDAAVDFSKQIVPIFKKHCLACHNATKHEGGLVIETPQSMLKGGESGPALTTKASGESLLLERASGQIEPLMPPADNKVAAAPLSSEELGLVKLWIDQGAAGSAAVAEAIHWQPLPAGVNPIYAVALSPDGQFAACGRANQVFIYHLPSRRFACRLTDPELMKRGVDNQPGVADLDLVQSLAFSPDGYTLASGGYRTVKLWSRPRDVRQFTFDALAAQAVAVTADGRWLATGGSDGPIKLFDLSTGQVARTLAGHTAAVTCLKFSADGAKLFSTSLDKSIRAWRVADGTPAGQIDAPAPQYALTIVGDGSQLAAGGADHVIRIWAVPQPAAPAAVAPATAPLRELAGHTQPVTSLATLPTAPTQIVSGSLDQSVRVWNTVDGKTLREIFHGGPVAAVAVRPDGARFASAGLNNIAKLWCAADGKLVAALSGNFRHELQVAAIEREVAGRNADLGFLTAAVAAADKTSAAEAQGVKKATANQAADDKALAAANAAAKRAAGLVAEAKAAVTAGQERLKQAETELIAAKKTSAAGQQPLRTLAFSPDNLQLAVAGDDGIVHTFSAENGAAFETYTGHTAPVLCVAFAGADNLVSADADQRAVVWNLHPAWTWQRTIGGADRAAGAADRAALVDRVTAVNFSPDGKLLATGGGEPSRSGELKLWNPADGSLVREIVDAHSDTILGLGFSPDGKYIASCGADKFVKVFDVAAGSLVRTFEGHTHHVLSVSWRADGRVLASGGGDNVIKVWDFATGEQQRTIAGFKKEVTSVTFVGTSPLAVSCSGDNTVHLHKTNDGRNVRTYAGGGDFMYSAAVTPDGKLLVAGGQDGVLRVWSGDDGKSLATFEPPKP